MIKYRLSITLYATEHSFICGLFNFRLFCCDKNLKTTYSEYCHISFLLKKFAKQGHACSAEGECSLFGSNYLTTKQITSYAMADTLKCRSTFDHENSNYCIGEKELFNYLLILNKLNIIRII